ncbi:hypothetical protein ABDB91_18090 [Desulfoscipio sp. XC116]|uniref:hypothetical protein n=1 Tax=Desulfoscipio sp. XC116 TaxID=3144975 RepID=UPI00325B9051
MVNPNIIIEVVVTEPLGTNCRKLIYNTGLVAEKLGLEIKITRGDSIKEELGEQIVPPFILIGELVLGKDIAPEKLEQLLTEQSSLK